MTDLPTTDDPALDALADALWQRMIGANADPVEFNMRAKLALEMRILGSVRVPFGLDKLTAAETAAYIGVQVETLQDRHKRRALRIADPYLIGRKLYWRRSELDPSIETLRLRGTEVVGPEPARNARIKPRAPAKIAAPRDEDSKPRSECVRSGPASKTLST